MNKRENTRLALLVAFSLVIVSGFLLERALMEMPLDVPGIAIDWKYTWIATMKFKANYGSPNFYFPPWVLPFIWPLTLFPLFFGWMVINLATFAVLIVAIPKGASKLSLALGALLLAISYPSLRNMMDGTLEVFVIVGILLIIRSSDSRSPIWLVIGVLLATTKIQETWMLLIAVAVWLQRDWSRKRRFRFLAWLILLTLPLSVWFGKLWIMALIKYHFSSGPTAAISMSLNKFVSSLGQPQILTWLLWGSVFVMTIWASARTGWSTSRTNVSRLICGSMLLAPYVSPISAITLLAITVTPFHRKAPAIYYGLFALYNLPYLLLKSYDFRVYGESAYFTVVLITTWIILVWEDKEVFSRVHV